MARQLDTRIVTSALIAVAAASVPAALVLSVCYGVLRLWLDALFVSLSHKANVVIAATFLHLLILGTFLWLYTRRSRLAPVDRQLVIDHYTPSIRAVLFCTFMMAVAAPCLQGNLDSKSPTS